MPVAVNPRRRATRPRDRGNPLPARIAGGGLFAEVDAPQQAPA